MDTLADMFAQIKNAQNAQKDIITIPFSKIKLAILEILKNHKQVGNYHLIDTDKDGKKLNPNLKKIEITLGNYNKIDIRRVSRPGRRIYATSVNIPYKRRPQSLIIVSTSKGVLEGEAARKKGLGGEVIAEIR